ncbi:MAG: CPXCG motif-containing cysteine-rich protein [Gammaproteobacteria bacterium]
MLQSECFLDCPYCGARISVLVDHSIEEQTYVEDCEVCCRPLSITAHVAGESVRIDAAYTDD